MESLCYVPRGSDGRVDPQVAADVLVMVEPKDPPVSAPDVCFTARDDWCAARTAREVAGSRFLWRFVLTRGSDERVPSEILESILGEVKVEEAHAAEASSTGQGEELDFLVFDLYPFPADFLSSCVLPVLFLDVCAFEF